MRIRRSKNDQEGHGQSKGVPYAREPKLCAVRALDAWLLAAAIATGPLSAPWIRPGASAIALYAIVPSPTS